MSGSLCPLCNKRLATLTITEVQMGGSVQSLHCCHHCVERLAIQLHPLATPIAEIMQRNAAQNPPGTSDDPLALAFAPSADSAHHGSDPDPDEQRSCPHCGLSWQDFLKRNRFGCAEDVEVFADLLSRPLIDLHGASDHSSSDRQAAEHAPAAVQSELQKLRAQLAQAVSQENFELAAKLRDALRQREQRPAASGPANDGPL